MSDDQLEQIVSDLTEKAIEITEKREAERRDEQAASPPTLAELSGAIMHSVGRALNDATRRVGDAMAGQSSFANDGDRRVAIALVSRLTQLLPMLEKVAETEADEQNSQVIPPCPMCGAELGQHWAHECPLVHDNARDRMVWDYGRKRVLFLRDFEKEQYYYGGTTPACGVCGAEPGTHWPDACPENPIRDKMIEDKVVPPKHQRKYLEGLMAERKRMKEEEMTNDQTRMTNE